MCDLLQHNYDDNNTVALSHLKQCDDARNALVLYLTENADTKLGLCTPPASSTSASQPPSDRRTLQLAKSVMDHHLHIATLCATYVSAWITVVESIERAGPSKLTMRLNPRARGAPLFQWRSSASLRCAKTDAPLDDGDCSFRFESVMSLVCATLAYLNCATAMRSYTTIAKHASDTLVDESTLDTNNSSDAVRAITGDMFAMNKSALFYALEAQQQLQLFRLSPTDSLVEMRPRVLEGLASHASYCMQQMALPRFFEQHRLGTPSGTRQLCAVHMALASLATITCTAANNAENTVVDGSSAEKMRDTSHLALVGQLSRSYNLVSAMALRADALVNEAHRRSENAEMTRAQECLRAARLLALFSGREATLGAMQLIQSRVSCPLQTVDNSDEVKKRWVQACTDRMAQWQEQVTNVAAKMLDRTSQAAVQILPSGSFDTVDSELLQKNVHELMQWLPQRSQQLSDAEIAQRLWHALQTFGERQYNGAQSLAQQASPSTAVREAVQHVTSSPMWTLPPVVGASKSATIITTTAGTTMDVPASLRSEAINPRSPTVKVEEAPASLSASPHDDDAIEPPALVDPMPMLTNTLDVLRRMPRVPTAPVVFKQQLVPDAAIAN